jgi:hypothetical protein
MAHLQVSMGEACSFPNESFAVSHPALLIVVRLAEYGNAICVVMRQSFTGSVQTAWN